MFTFCFAALKNFIKNICFYRSSISTMVLWEIQARYIGTFGGLIWSLVNPLLMILVYWFVFSVGFKIQPSGGVPYIAVFLCGLIPWSLFSETLMANMNVVLSNAHLVTKTIFPTEILPIVNLVVSLVTHVIMLLILIAIMLSNGIPLSIYNLQFLYYLLAMSIFTIGLSWMVAALNVFFRDVGQILGVLLNLWFWMTPIVWLMDIIPAEYRFYFNFNPMMYIVSGYRHAFIDHIPFWHDYRTGAYFWGITLVFFFTGGLIFKKLKPEFAEVL